MSSTWEDHMCHRNNVAYSSTEGPTSRWRRQLWTSEELMWCSHFLDGRSLFYKPFDKAQPSLQMVTTSQGITEKKQSSNSIEWVPPKTNSTPTCPRVQLCQKTSSTRRRHRRPNASSRRTCSFPSASTRNCARGKNVKR